VQYVQVNALQAWKIAAFLVAFFSSFFSYSIDFTKLDGKPPETTSDYIFTCNSQYVTEPECLDILASTHNASPTKRNASCFTEQDKMLSSTVKSIYPKCVYEYLQNPDTDTWGSTFHYRGWLNGSQTEIKGCPSEQFPSHTVANDSDDDGVIDQCYHPNDVKAQIDEQNELDKNEDYCKELILDSGNNSASTMCYSAYNGASCTVSQVTVGDATYYKGTANETLGCGSSENDPFDSSGTGDDKDGCMFSGGTNYCKASEEKHCKDVQGTKICDDGCIDDGANVYCDTSKHPDVGEGESDYFNDNGTCSVIAASSTKGFCEDMGGTWDETQNATEADCPIGTGSCSVATSGHCGACLDSGGVWTPDNAIPVSEEAKATVEVAALTKKSNEKLAQIENATRKGTEALISTTKSGDGKIVAALEELTKIVKDKPSGGGAAQEERETYTTTTAAIDKSKISALFDDSSKATLQAEIEQLKTDTTNFINLAKAEASALMTITVPSATGYESRVLTLSQGTFDLSLGRFDYFFKLLAGPIMLLCSLYAAFILLRRD